MNEEGTKGHKDEVVMAVLRRVEDILTGWTGAGPRADTVAAPTNLAGEEDEPAYRPIDRRLVRRMFGWLWP